MAIFVQYRNMKCAFKGVILASRPYNEGLIRLQEADWDEETWGPNTFPAKPSECKILSRAKIDGDFSRQADIDSLLIAMSGLTEYVHD